MPTISRRSPASAAISKSAIGKVSSTLQNLPEKPREKLSLREAVSELHESITTALDRGYSYDEVVKILANQGVNITVASLKRYLAAARKESGVYSKGKRSSEPPRSTSAKAAQSATEATPDRRQSRTSSSPTSSSRTGSSRTGSSRSNSTAKPTEKTPTRSRTAAKTKPTSTTKPNSRSAANQRQQRRGKSA